MVLRFLRLFRLALWRGFEHDVFTTARAAAYYSILTLFPTLMVVAAILAASHDTAEFIKEIVAGASAILPPGTPAAISSSFENPNNRPTHVLISASIVVLFAASGVVVSWMEGFLRAYRMGHAWHPVKERVVALILVLLAFFPMAIATLLVAFGNQIEQWMLFHTIRELSFAIFLFWRFLRWAISAITSVAVLTLIYHLGLPRWQPWYRVIPGAGLATVLWLSATEVFGWYVTKYGTYNLIYGPLGVAIALLVWMYIISLIVLIGAEFNAIIFPRTHTARAAQPAARESAD